MRDIIRLGQVQPVRRRVMESTTSLLGNTIVLSEEQWRAPSALPGWTRAMVASHIARNAEAFARLVRHRSDPAFPLYPSEAERLESLDAGAQASALQLQVDLDTTADTLEAALDTVEDWTAPVTLPLVGEQPIAALCIARLHEVCLHHIDLDCGFTPERLDPVPGRWLLQWACQVRQHQDGMPALRVVSDSGVDEVVGEDPEPAVVTGTDAALWAWLTGRSGGDGVGGADGRTWPLLG